MRFALMVALALVPAYAYAQSAPSLSALGNASSVPPLTLDLTPESPEPGSTVLVTPESTLIDLSNSTISIRVNGAPFYSGSARSVAVPLGANGTVTTIAAIAVSQGQSYTASLTLDPGDVSLVAEPVSSGPALYPGKSLIPDSGSVRLVAIADFETAPGRRISPSALVYTWSESGSTLDSFSGIGKNSIMVEAPLSYRDETVSVAVTSQDGSVTGSGSVDIVPQEPIVRLYAEDPLMGILYDHALTGSYKISGSESALAAVPYSFPTDTSLPTITWFLDGSAAQTGSSITLRPSGSGGGNASLSASASAGQVSSSAGLSLLFGSASSGGLFGL